VAKMDGRRIDLLDLVRVTARPPRTEAATDGR
jgi:hypothetical protein